ncbi:helix-turn-helix transcriptional regulator [Paenibacillus kribbensis]|uniref:helix-turn-helix transcriptional regulator n=1 Tax=Paenibacillus kribbensis TaxID=172713 RepID=UPI000838FA96|nr:helix-turn-helix transcriptional regulator [Paenibacillus kribbensis]
MSNNSKSKALGAFLKSRRYRLQPGQAGIRHLQGQRRTPGLRREEVAMLAGVSATYYTWLEQGREVTASREIIENIGKALQLTHDELVHLIQLWNPNETTTVSSTHTKLNLQWQNIMDQLTYPSFISNERAEVLAWNRAANEVIMDFSSLSASERVMIRLLFVDPGLRNRMVNWEEFASYSVAVFRTYYDKHLGDLWFEETVEQLRVESIEFDTMWKQHKIQLKKVNRVSFHIPDAVEAVSYDINSLASIVDHPGLHICIYTPVL